MLLYELQYKCFQDYHRLHLPEGSREAGTDLRSLVTPTESEERHGAASEKGAHTGYEEKVLH